MKIKDIAHHRNGISGDGFTIVLFSEWGDNAPDSHTFMATIPDTYRFDPDSPDGVQCFVVDLDLLPSIEFAQGNSWRGDVAFHDLLAAGLWAAERYVIHNGDQTDPLYWNADLGWLSYHYATLYPLHLRNNDTLSQIDTDADTDTVRWVHASLI